MPPQQCCGRDEAAEPQRLRQEPGLTPARTEPRWRKADGQPRITDLQATDIGRSRLLTQFSTRTADPARHAFSRPASHARDMADRGPGTAHHAARAQAQRTSITSTRTSPARRSRTRCRPCSSGGRRMAPGAGLNTEENGKCSARPAPTLLPKHTNSPPTKIADRLSDLRKQVVRDTGIEPVTSTVSR